MSGKYLIITADDFGCSTAVNEAVVKGWQDGILTGASLMVTGAAWEEAVELARQQPGLQVGLHLTLVQGRSVLHHGGFPSLTDREGSFPDDPLLAGLRMFFLKPLYQQLRREIEAQLDRFAATGLTLSHIDGHCNMHMHPTVFAMLCQLLPHYGISTFRLSRERLAAELRLSCDRVAGKAVDAFIFGRLASRCRPELQLRRIGFAAEVKGLLNSGRMTEDYLLKALDTLQEGITEIYLHPSENDSPLLPDYRQSAELAALLSRKVREKIASQGIILCNYRGEVKNER
jgi:chitin disaccharide deacetylase